MKELSQNPYLYEYPTGTISGDIGEKCVVRALECLRQGNNIIEDRREDIQVIEANHRAAFSGDPPIGNEFTESRISYNVCKKIHEKLTFIEFDIDFYPKENNEESDKILEAQKQKKIQEKLKEVQDIKIATEEIEIEEEDKEKFLQSLIKSGVKAVMQKADMSLVMKQSDTNVFWEILEKGDAFIMPLVDKDADFPIKYNLIQWDNVYFMQGDKQIRGAADGRNVTRVMIVYKYNYDEFRKNIAEKLPKKWREKAENCAWGALPNIDLTKRDNQTFYTYNNSVIEDNQNREGQMGIYVDLETEEVIWIAGGNATIIKHLKGAEFPYRMNNRPYIPLVHLKGIKASETPYNYSIGHYMIQPNFIDKVLRNEVIQGTINEINPPHYIQVPNGKSQDTQGLLYQMEINRQQGHIPLIIDEADENNQFKLSPVQKLTGGTTSGAADSIKALIDEDIRRLGESIDAADMPASQTATATISEGQEATRFAGSIMERNAPEFKFLIELTIDLIKKNIPRSSKIKYNTNDVFASNPVQKKIRKDMNLGILSDYLKNHDADVKVRPMTGAIPNIAVTLAKLQAAQMAAMGTPYAPKITQKILQEYGFNPNIKELQMQPEAPMEQPAEQPQPEQLNQQLA